MSVLESLIILAIILLFAGIFFYMVRSDQRARAAKLAISQSLGFTPIEADTEFLYKVSELYRNIRMNRFSTIADQYELQNVSQKIMPDGKLFIFDLVDTSGEDDSYMEKQAVAVVSDHLNLPPLVIFPKADMDGAVANLANKFLGWLISKVGSPVTFPQIPEFEERYVVSSPDPEGTRRFLDENKLRRLANTKLYGIHAQGDMFTLSRMDIAAKSLTKEMMSERVNQAMGVFSIFTS